MAGEAAGEVVNLLPAGDARNGDLGCGGGSIDGGEEREGAHAAGDVIVLGLEAKGTGHAAACGID